MEFSGIKMWTLLVSYLVAQAKAYPMQTWPMYPQTPREYPEDDYYAYAPKVQYYYDAPAPAAPMAVPDAYGQVPYPSYVYDPYGQFNNEAPKEQEERLADLPIGQETWFESEPSPRWRSNDVDDVSAAFLDNLILTQMAQDAQRRRENARAAFNPPSDYDEKYKESEDEDVRELKALVGKPLYHVPKTVPKIEDDSEDYTADDTFINWDGNKRSLTTAAPTTTTQGQAVGQKEVMLPRPADKPHHKVHVEDKQSKRSSNFYNTLAQMLNESNQQHRELSSTKARRIDKRYVAGDSDLVFELRGLKHRIAT